MLRINLFYSSFGCQVARGFGGGGVSFGQLQLDSRVVAP